MTDAASVELPSVDEEASPPPDVLPLEDAEPEEVDELPELEEDEEEDDEDEPPSEDGSVTSVLLDPPQWITSAAAERRAATAKRATLRC